MDADGVALAAIQGLYQAVQEKDARISQLEAQNAALEQRMAALEAQVAGGSAKPTAANLLPLGWVMLGMLLFGTLVGWRVRRRGGP